MAQMYPENGPFPGKDSAAEQNLYWTLKRGLSDDYLVFHAPQWQYKNDKDGRIVDGEVDFIVVHPRYGLLFIEVKGDGIEFDGTQQQWRSRDRYGVLHNIEDPFRQVVTSVHVLARYLRNVPATQPYKYRLGEAVWFPDCDWNLTGVALPHVTNDLVLASNDVLDPQSAIERVYRHLEQGPAQKQHFPLNAAAVQALLEVLAPTIQVAPVLSAQIEAERSRIAQLTQEQFEQLERMGRMRRLAVRGSAGTGKTIIAIEKAYRLATQGMDVLLLCRRRTLASWIQSIISRGKLNISTKVRVCHLDDLCLQLSTAAALPYELRATSSTADLIKQFGRAFDTLQRSGSVPGFDAILVDEAQDIDRPIWPFIQRLLRDQKQSFFYVFYDPAQRDMPDEWELPDRVVKEHVPLTRNCRNTKVIFELTKRFYTGIDDPVCEGPEGEEPWIIDPQNVSVPAFPDEDSEVTALRHALDTLIGEGKMNPDRIHIVSCRAQAKSRWYTRKIVGSHELTWHIDGKAPGRVAVTSVRSAKGLERDIVILSELDGLDDDPRRDALLYIAFSRAKHRIVVLGSPDYLHLQQPALWGAHPGRRQD